DGPLALPARRRRDLAGAGQRRRLDALRLNALGLLALRLLGGPRRLELAAGRRAGLRCSGGHVGRLGVDVGRLHLDYRTAQFGAGDLDLEAHLAGLQRLDVDAEDSIGPRRQPLDRLEDDRLALFAVADRALGTLELHLVRHRRHELDVGLGLRA